MAENENGLPKVPQGASVPPPLPGDQSQATRESLFKNFYQHTGLSKRALAFGIGAVLVFFAFIFIGLANRGQQAVDPNAVSEDDEEKVQTAKHIDGLDFQGSGTIKEKMPVTLPDPDEAVVSAKNDEPEPVKPPEPVKEKPAMLAGPAPVSEDLPEPPQNQQPSPAEQMRMQYAQQIAQSRMSQFQASLQGKMSVSTGDMAKAYDPNDPDSIDAEKARVQREIARNEQRYNDLTAQRDGGAQNTGGTGMLDVSDYQGPSYPGDGPQGGGPGRRSTLKDYSGYGGRDWNLKASLENPTTDYSIRAGTVLPAVLISGINSDLPGQITAQVSQNVYDTATGKYLLVPQGTRLVGTYGSDVRYGQERVMIAWNRLVYPDNRVLDLGSMPGADMAGYAGFTDQVNNHWWKLIANAFLMSGVVAAVSVSVNNDNNSASDSNKSSMSDEMRVSLASQFGEVIGQVIQRNLTVSPTLEIRPGYRFNVTVTKDMEFERPYKIFDYK